MAPPWNLGLLPIVSLIIGFFPNWALLALRCMAMHARVRDVSQPARYFEVGGLAIDEQSRSGNATIT